MMKNAANDMILDYNAFDKKKVPAVQTCTVVLAKYGSFSFEKAETGQIVNIGSDGLPPPKRYFRNMKKVF